MTVTLRRVVELIRAAQVLISAHGYDEMTDDGILAAEAIGGDDRRSGNRNSGIPLGRGRPSLSPRAGQIRPLDGLSAEEMMRQAARRTRLVREGAYAAEVEVEVIDAEGGWAPYLSPADAGRLDQVREALRRGDVAEASRLARVFRLGDHCWRKHEHARR